MDIISIYHSYVDYSKILLKNLFNHVNENCMELTIPHSDESYVL